jgi:tRNA pseudouridine13 synthase
MNPIDPLHPPMLTADLPGVGGRIKVELADFVVEEIPSYLPGGSGEHLYMWVEKRGVGPEHLTRVLAKQLNIPINAIGTAGLKDRYAVTRQWVSVPQQALTNLSSFRDPDVTILEHNRHNNKLKPGHLKGNCFDILIRDVNVKHKAHVEAILQRISQQGLPNYYGPQRFGRDGGNIDLGFQCLAGTQPKRLRPFVYKFALSALQSFLFNDYLGQRLQDGLFRTVLPGEVMGHWPQGGLFVAEDVPTEQARMDRRETVPLGPMFGQRTFAAGAQAAEREAVILKRHWLQPNSFDNFGQLMGGTRRHNLIYIDDLSALWEPAGLRMKFSLPSGCYATVLLGEVMKTEVNAEE